MKTRFNVRVISNLAQLTEVEQAMFHAATDLVEDHHIITGFFGEVLLFKAFASHVGRDAHGNIADLGIETVYRKCYDEIVNEHGNTLVPAAEQPKSKPLYAIFKTKSNVYCTDGQSLRVQEIHGRRISVWMERGGEKPTIVDYYINELVEFIGRFEFPN